jgi:hypothetical protein
MIKSAVEEVLHDGLNNSSNPLYKTPPRLNKPKQSSKPQSTWPRRVIRASFWILGLASSLVSPYELRPKVTIGTTQSTDRRDALASQFAIRNESVFAFAKPKIYCFVANAKKAYIGGWMENIYAFDPNVQPDEIPPGQTVTNICALGPIFRLSNSGSAGTILTYADIAVIINFDYLLWKKRTLERRFVMVRDKDGYALWSEQPVKQHEGLPQRLQTVTPPPA